MLNQVYFEPSIDEEHKKQTEDSLSQNLKILKKQKNQLIKSKASQNFQQPQKFNLKSPTAQQKPITTPVTRNNQVEIDKFFKTIQPVDQIPTSIQNGPSQPQKQQSNHICEHGEHRQTQVDSDGNTIEVVTEFSMSEYRHTCRSCREMESLVYANKVQNNGTTSTRSKVKLNQKPSASAINCNATEQQLRALDTEQLIRIILILQAENTSLKAELLKMRKHNDDSEIKEVLKDSYRIFVQLINLVDESQQQLDKKQLKRLVNDSGIAMRISLILQRLSIKPDLNGTQSTLSSLDTSINSSYKQQPEQNQTVALLELNTNQKLEISRLNQMNQNQQQQISELVQDLNQAYSDKDQLEQRIQQLKEQISLFKMDVIKFENIQYELNQQLKKHEKTDLINKDLTAQLSQLKQYIDQIKAQEQLYGSFQNCEVKLKQTEEELNNRLFQIESLDELEQKAAEHARILEDIKILSEQLSDYKMQEDEMRQLESQYFALQGELQMANFEKNRLKDILYHDTDFGKVRAIVDRIQQIVLTRNKHDFTEEERLILHQLLEGSQSGWNVRQPEHDFVVGDSQVNEKLVQSLLKPSKNRSLTKKQRPLDRDLLQILHLQSLVIESDF